MTDQIVSEEVAELRDLAADLDQLATRARGTRPEELDGDEYGLLAENIVDRLFSIADRLVDVAAPAEAGKPS